jgi:hypothetical protein
MTVFLSFHDLPRLAFRQLAIARSRFSRSQLLLSETHNPSHLGRRHPARQWQHSPRAIAFQATSDAELKTEKMSLDVVGLQEALSVKKAVANPNSKRGPMGWVRHFEQTRNGEVSYVYVEKGSKPEAIWRALDRLGMRLENLAEEMTNGK